MSNIVLARDSLVRRFAERHFTSVTGAKRFAVVGLGASRVVVRVLQIGRER